MRRLLVVNALIFAVLAAAAALAYYGFSATTESPRERELALMKDLAEEKVLNVEQLVTNEDKKLMSAVNIDELGEPLQKLVAATSSTIAWPSVYVLDAEQKLLPGGFVSTREPREGVAMRDWFLERVLSSLSLQQAKVGVRGHFYQTIDGRPYLFSYMKRVSRDRTFYVVIEDDLVHLFLKVFNQYFTDPSNRRLYQVVDENHNHRWGEPFDKLPGGLVVEQPFSETVTGWVLRVGQKDVGDRAADERKRLVNSFLIGGAVVVILGGLAVLGFAIRRERRLSDLKSEFISNVSHELKTPLSIISMFGEMLANGRTKSPEQAHEYAEIIWRESVRLGRLIDNVLDFAKIERGMGGYEFAEDVDPGEVVERAIELSGRRVAAAEMTLESDLAAELPPVRLDTNAYTLALLNLIDNAIKYAAEGKKIVVSLKHEGDRVVLGVRDWGPGIDADEHERIFERFYRAKAVRLKPIRGSGIGLALVQHIARAHGGDVTVESAPDRGSTFSIWIPVSGKNDP